MNRTRFHQLLEKAAAAPLTPAEEQEFEHLLAEPANRAALDDDVAEIRDHLGLALAGRAEPHFGRSSRLAKQDALDAVIAELGANPSVTTERSPPRWRFATAAVLLAAACLALVFTWINSGRTAPTRVELALISKDTLYRGSTTTPGAAPGLDWHVVPFASLTALAEWTRQPLPADIKARIWIDEEKEMLRALTRDRQGTTVHLSRPLNPHEPPDAQLRNFAAHLAAP